MIQDIMPKKLYNQYRNFTPKDNDIILFFEGSSVLGKYDGDEIVYPDYELFTSCVCRADESLIFKQDGKDGKKDNTDIGIDLKNVTDARKLVSKICGQDKTEQFTFRYLFSVDNERYFLAVRNDEIQHGEFSGEMSDSKIHSEYKSFIEGFEFIGVNSFRRAIPKYRAFAVITAYHLYGWYRDNKFCGRCGKAMMHDDKERMMKCPVCNNMVFPKISPAVIIGVTDGDRILFTKYAQRTYTNYALVAGFAEIGETLEETVIREVKEETGLDVTNVRYYKSQPWALSGSLLAGFYCDLKGSDKIKLQEDELSVAEWVKADDIHEKEDGISLTKEMMLKFKEEHMSSLIR